MFNQLRGTLAPLPAEDVAAAYAPFGSIADAAAAGVRRPRGAGLGAGQHLLRLAVPGHAAGSFAEPGTQHSVETGAGGVLRGPRRRRRAAGVRQRLPAPRPRAGAVREHRQAALDRLPVPRLDLPARRQPAGRAGRLPQARGLRHHGSSAWPSWTPSSGTAGCSSTRAAEAGPFEDHVAELEAIVAPYRQEDLVTVATHEYELADQLEGDRRELPGVLPLLHRSTPSCAGSARRRAARTSSPTATGSAAGWTCAEGARRCRSTAAAAASRSRASRRARAAHRDVRRRAAPTC